MINDGIIYLRAPEPRDLGVMYSVENDCSLWSLSNVRGPMSMKRLEEYVDSYNPNVLETDSGRFVICLSDSDSVVGFVDYFELDLLNRRCGVGLMVLNESRRHGFGTRALNLLARYMGRDLGLHSLWAVIGAENAASQHAFRAAGFTESGRLHDWVRYGDRFTAAILVQRLLSPQLTDSPI